MSTRSAARGLGLAAFGGAAVFGLFAGCALDIDESLSCGDGYVSDAEECDPADVERAFVDACRARGFQIDAACDPLTCRILDSDLDCNVCGDGIARGNEACDGADLRNQDCPGDALGTLGCTASCKFDVSDCPTVCGDGFRSGDEECDPALDCEEDQDCSEGEVCYLPAGECVSAGDGFVPDPVVACRFFDASFAGLDKPYVDGEIGECIPDECVFARDHCSFCGDGILDGAYDDYTNGQHSTHAAEVCDMQAADPVERTKWCREACEVQDADYDEVRCDFACADDCSGFGSPDGKITPDGLSPADLHCCIASPDCNEMGALLPCCEMDEGG